MVSFWPWKGDNSAESFEKTLSALATKIASATAHNDRLRQRARNYKATWILYGGFTYLVAALILTLVTGWKSWGAVEYSTIVGAPVLLIAGRVVLTRYYNYRITNSQEYLDGLQKERQATIEKLKQATKYDSTQQLLDKYGATPKKEAPIGQKQNPPAQKQSNRIILPIPPTANIQRKPDPASNLSLQQQKHAPLPVANAQLPVEMVPISPRAGEDFAPNAYDGPPPPQFAPSAEVAKESHWYDRILDALLGEDESQAKNRLALICNQCRIVNGLAPPGIKTPEELGKWRCSGCGAWNGEDFADSKLLEEARKTETLSSPDSTFEDISTTSLDVPSKKSLRERKRSPSTESDTT